LAELLKSFGGVSGEAAAEQKAAAEEERAALIDAESMMEEDKKDDGVFMLEIVYRCCMHTNFIIPRAYAARDEAQGIPIGC
jgi:hypothetical protein